MKLKQLYESTIEQIIEESFKQFDQVWHQWIVDMPDSMKYSKYPPNQRESELSANLMYNATFRNQELTGNSEDIASIIDTALDMTNTSSTKQLTPPIVLEFLIKNRIKIDLKNSSDLFVGNPNDISSWISNIRRGHIIRDHDENLAVIWMLEDIYKTLVYTAKKRIERNMLKNPEYDVVYRGVQL